MFDVLLQVEEFRIGMIWEWICEGFKEFILTGLILLPIIYIGVKLKTKVDASYILLLVFLAAIIFLFYLWLYKEIEGIGTLLILAIFLLPILGLFSRYFR